MKWKQKKMKICEIWGNMAKRRERYEPKPFLLTVETLHTPHAGMIHDSCQSFEVPWEIN